MKDAFTFVGIIAALVLASVGIVRSVGPVPTPPAGAITGPDIFIPTFFHEVATMGGGDFATSSIGAVTYTAASINNSRVIEHIAGGALTATLPTNAALSAIGFLPNVGDTRTIYLHASTTAITLAGNTGMTLFSASSTKQVANGSIGRLDFVRLGASEGRLIEVILSAD